MVPRKTNSTAIASLICACLPFLFVTPLVAVICGHVARRQIRKTGEQGAGLALAGLIVGYIFLAFALLAIAIPVFLSTRDSHTTCFPCNNAGTFAYSAQEAQGDLRDLATAEENYLLDHGNYTRNVNELVGTEQFTPLSGDMNTTVSLTAHGNASYCIVVGEGTDSQYYLYDSPRGWPSVASYPSEATAQSSCSLRSPFSAPVPALGVGG